MTRPNLRSIWLELLLSLLVATAEAAAVAPWLPLLAKLFHNMPSPSPLGVFVIGIVSFWLARAMIFGGWDVAQARAVSLATWVVLVLAWYAIVAHDGIRAPLDLVSRLIELRGAELLLVVVAGVAWWRAIALASEPNPFTPEFARRLVWRGAFIAGVPVVIAALQGGSVATAVDGTAVVAVPIYLLASLSAAGTAQARAARRVVRAGGDPVRLGLSIAAGLAVIALIVALLLAALAGHGFINTLTTGVSVTGQLLSKAIFLLLLGVAYVVFTLLTPVFWLLHHLAGKPAQPQQNQNPGQSPFDQFAQNAQHGWPAWVRLPLEIGLAALVVLFIFWLILRSLRRYHREAADRPIDEVHESLWSPELPLSQLRGLLSRLVPSRPHRAESFKVNLDAEPASVRDAYRHLLVLAKRHGEPRLESETPNDFLIRLDRRWTDLQGALGDLTTLYVRARYGHGESEDELRRARAAWRTIHRGTTDAADGASPRRG